MSLAVAKENIISILWVRVDFCEYEFIEPAYMTCIDYLGLKKLHFSQSYFEVEELCFVETFGRRTVFHMTGLNVSSVSSTKS